MGCNASIPGDPTEYYDIWDAYCEFCYPLDWRGKMHRLALQYGMTRSECWLLRTIIATRNKSQDQDDFRVTIEELTALLNKEFNPSDDPEEKVFTPEQVQRMLTSLVTRAKCRLTLM